MRFALVVPALNEEAAIAGTLRRALAARERVAAETAVDDMTVVFVNDGSSDRTQEIVDQPEFDEVVKVYFRNNQGYGAAIKAGWGATDAEILGFMDADGTCDPEDAVALLARLLRTGADVVLAARLSPDSKMPPIRRLGNVLFAKLLGAVSRQRLTDCASGFRVVRRSSLRLISPLPTGMHFTPAMSAICLLDPRLKIEEVPIHYEERIGRSKLSVLKDGLRFLYVILFTVCCYNPIRTMLAVATLWCVLIAALSAPLVVRGASPAGLALGGALVAMATVWTGIVCHQMNYLLIGPRRHWGRLEGLLQAVTEYKVLIVGGLSLLAASLAGLVARGLAGPATGPVPTGLMIFLLVSGAMAALVGVMVRVVWAIGQKQQALLPGGPEAPAFEPPPPAVTVASAPRTIREPVVSRAH